MSSLWHRRRPPGLPVPAAVDLGEAEAFLESFYTEHPDAGNFKHRLAVTRYQLEKTGTYEQTPEELGWAAKVAWRHAARCSGRDRWRSLRLRDRRHIRDAAGVAAETVEHLRAATNGGRIRSTITVFAPDAPGRPGPRILNSQAVRYAGYAGPGTGPVTGDPASTDLTDLAIRLGWGAGGGRFDILPLVVQGSTGRLRSFDIPRSAVLEVPITHPDYEWFAGLGLRWYATPVITDMYLDAGGLRYPCAPFNGWYQATTEVGARDLGDRGRYNVLPAVAAGMGLDTSRLDSLWKDRALVELAKAVHHSYCEAGVVVSDHHSEAERFVRFVEREEKEGRVCPVDWKWVVPPLSSSAAASFHRTYADEGPLKPGYFRHTDTAELLSR